MENRPKNWQGTTILSVRKGDQVVIAADGQVSLESLIIKTNVRKVRKLLKGNVIVAFTGSTADALTLFERLESKLEQNPHQLLRPCVDLVREWRKDPLLRDINDMMVVVNPRQSLILTSTGEVYEPEDGIIGIGCGGAFALSAARALIDVEGLSAQSIVEKSMKIASDMCVFTDSNLTLESLETKEKQTELMAAL